MLLRSAAGTCAEWDDVRERARGSVPSQPIARPCDTHEGVVVEVDGRSSLAGVVCQAQVQELHRLATAIITRSVTSIIDTMTPVMIL